jgi:ribosomal protein S18 acetylase RimI-like enzyme
VASWEAYAAGSAGGALRRLDGVSVAVFPTAPERAVYNNALLERRLGPARRAGAVDSMIAAYETAAVDHYAAWVHETDERMAAELRGRGYAVAETTRAMGVALPEASIAAPAVEVEPLEWRGYLEYLQLIGLPLGLLRGADPGAFHVLGVRWSREVVATAIAFDHDGDCGIYNMSTREAYRRRGLGTALTRRHLGDAMDRGCATASLQATPIAERIYAGEGFRDLGRIREYAPR